MCGIPRIGRPLNAFSTNVFWTWFVWFGVSFLYFSANRAFVVDVCPLLRFVEVAGRERTAHNIRGTRCPADKLWPVQVLSRPRFRAQGPPRRKPSGSRPELRLGYPLNLSILVSGGIETKKDSLSNGERTGKSSRRKSGRFVLTCGV